MSLCSLKGKPTHHSLNIMVLNNKFGKIVHQHNSVFHYKLFYTFLANKTFLHVGHWFMFRAATKQTMCVQMCKTHIVDLCIVRTYESCCSSHLTVEAAARELLVQFRLFSDVFKLVLRLVASAPLQSIIYSILTSSCFAKAECRRSLMRIAPVLKMYSLAHRLKTIEYDSLSPTIEVSSLKAGRGQYCLQYRISRSRRSCWSE